MAARVFQRDGGQVDRDRRARPLRPPIEPLFLMPIDRVRALDGELGTAAAGRVWRGTLYKGELVRILGLTDAQAAVVATIEVQGESRDKAVPGDEAELVLRGVEPGSVRVGQALAAPRHRAVAPSRPAFGAELYLVRPAGGAWKRIVAHS